jgi:hypothetical protein
MSWGLMANNLLDLKCQSALTWSARGWSVFYKHVVSGLAGLRVVRLKADTTYE